MRKIFFWVIIILCVVSGCNMQSEAGVNYTINYDSFIQSGFSHEYVQISGLDDKTISTKVNDQLKRAATAWVYKYPNISHSTPERPYVHYQSNNLLSVGNTFEFSGRKYIYSRIHITINLKTGEIMKLNDIVKMDNAFINLIKNGDIVRAAGGADDTEILDANLRVKLEEMPINDFLEIINRCSQNIDITGALDNCFFLEGECIVIKINDSWVNDILIPFEAIKEYIKVEL